MLIKSDKEIIEKISRQYNVRRVLLFGSSATPEIEGHDIDLAVEGLSPCDYYKYYGELMFSLSRPVDLVDLSQKTKFTGLIQEEGVLLYG